MKFALNELTASEMNGLHTLLLSLPCSRIWLTLTVLLGQKNGVLTNNVYFILSYW